MYVQSCTVRRQILFFIVKSKKYESKYYTNAIVEKISVVAKKSQQLEVDMETGEILQKL